ncbi:MAG: restriction endonuclease [Gammaproteobacteria bacterium]|nr:restriction endonuclease [Gammaproteobacteria bacterium]
MNTVPSKKELIRPTVEALKSLGGSGTNREISGAVIEVLRIPDEIASKPHRETGNQTRLEYNLAWARTCLARSGIVENAGRGVWAIVPDKQDAAIDEDEIYKSARRAKTKDPASSVAEDEPSDEDDDAASWRDELSQVLTETLSPGAFERLAQRLLRACGFTEVEVTGKSGDGGIDGKGIAKVNDLISFPVIFQCKRYKSPVPAGDIRNFRGAMTATDKGLFITTSTFTRGAQQEATRPGVTPIDLIDGEQLMDKLKELRIGIAVETKTVEVVTVNKDWYAKL